MKKREAIEEELGKIPGWQLVHNKKGILGPMEKLLDPEESVMALLDGLYCDGKIARQEKEVPGVLFLTKKRILFVSGEGKSGLFNEIPLSDLRSISRNKKSSFHELTIRSKTQVMELKTFAGSSSAKVFVDAVADITGGTVESRESDTARLVDEINRSFEALTRLNREIGQDLSRKLESPATGESAAISTFLFAEAAEIRTILAEYLSKNLVPELVSTLRDDLLILTSLLMDPVAGLADTERVFIALVMIPLMESESWRYGAVARTIVGAKEYPQEITADCVGYIASLDNYIDAAGKKPLLNGGSLRSMKLLMRYDAEHGSGHADRLGTALYNFGQCLAKADGTVRPEEEERLKQIHRLILQRDATAGSPAPAAEGEKVETLEEVMEKINALVGMQPIKDEINSLVNLIKVQKRRRELDLPATPVSLHSVFYGPPGTGKTTIARLLGKVFRALGMISKGQLIETDRAGLVAGYVGQTAINVDTVVQKALDGVLFIDEAYSLVPEQAGGSDFGREAIDTILKRMEDYRDRLVVIVAGYTDEMERFIDSNPGLKSRFSRYFYFDHYDPEDLYRIFEIFIGNASFVLDEKAAAKMKALLSAMHKKRDRSFGNGRLVRNIFEKTVERQANRIAGITPLTGEVLCAITEADIPDEPEVSPGGRGRHPSS